MFFLNFKGLRRHKFIGLHMNHVTGHNGTLETLEMSVLKGFSYVPPPPQTPGVPAPGLKHSWMFESSSSSDFITCQRLFLHKLSCCSTVPLCFLHFCVLLIWLVHAETQKLLDSFFLFASSLTDLLSILSAMMQRNMIQRGGKGRLTPAAGAPPAHLPPRRSIIHSGAGREHPWDTRTHTHTHCRLSLHCLF